MLAALSIALPLVADAKAKGWPGELVRLPGLPVIGKWMLSRNGSVADWLGQPLGGKRLLEPINVIILDPFASSRKNAAARLLAACAKAGFEPSNGHSRGYSALIGADSFPQIPGGEECTFSDAPFVLKNNHGRVFGPLEWHGEYIFTAAFSRERTDLRKFKHYYVSFDEARDAFVRRLSARSAYRILSSVDLDNALSADNAFTTGDHDGKAVILRASE